MGNRPWPFYFTWSPSGNSGWHNAVFDLETSNFSQGLGNQGFERRRSTLRRTIKSADWRRDCGKGPFPDEN